VSLVQEIKALELQLAEERAANVSLRREMDSTVDEIKRDAAAYQDALHILRENTMKLIKAWRGNAPRSEFLDQMNYLTRKLGVK
jgi:uncharacterized protein YukE